MRGKMRVAGRSGLLGFMFWFRCFGEKFQNITCESLKLTFT